mgnify:CR=1 FL=1
MGVSNVLLVQCSNRSSSFIYIFIQYSRRYFNKRRISRQFITARINVCRSIDQRINQDKSHGYSIWICKSRKWTHNDTFSPLQVKSSMTHTSIDAPPQEYCNWKLAPFLLHYIHVHRYCRLYIAPLEDVMSMPSISIRWPSQKFMSSPALMQCSTM